MNIFAKVINILMQKNSSGEFFFSFSEIFCKSMIKKRIFAGEKQKNNMKKIFALIGMAAVLTTGCGSRQQETNVEDMAISTHKNVPGDSALYGLACDGCTDSMLVVLPLAGGDPDTFDIINARLQRQIYGIPHIGDQLAVIINPVDSDEALTVINLEALKGDWCYQVTPTLRHPEQMSSRIQRRLRNLIPDSVLQEQMKPKEYHLRLKRDQTAMAYGGPRQRTTDNMGPVEFPPVKHYTQWHLFNGRLILKADTIKGFTTQKEPETDTVAIRLLMKDSLVLEFPDHTQAYYRKR